jgi:hypothetical protein
VPIKVAEKESLAGLKYYSSFGELEGWISSDGGTRTVPEGSGDGAVA